MKVAVFVDESYSSFFELSDDDGYFCVGLFLVPIDQIGKFNTLFSTYRHQLVQAKGMASRDFDDELKAKHLRTIPDQIRRDALRPIMDWARDCGAKVGGFFTSTRGYINYSLRTDEASEGILISGVGDPDRVAHIRNEIRRERASEPAESLMVGDIMQVVAGMLLYYCGNRGLEFTLHYDPRNEHEDRRVFERLEQVLYPLEGIIMGRTGVFLGCCNSVDSRNSFGIQMADHITRDIREMFRRYPALLTESSKQTAITSKVTSLDGTMFTQISGRSFKWGESFKISEGLIRSLFFPSAPFCLTDYYDIILAKRVSCYSTTGEARVINLEDFLFENMVD